MKTSGKLFAGIAAMAISLYVQAYPGESIVRDPATGNYTITYRGDPNATELSQTTFVPSTKIVPTIRSSFRLSERGVIMYHYTVSNGATAKQAIVGVLVDGIVNPIIGEIPFPSGTFPNEAAEKAALDAYNAAETAAVAAPAGWYGGIHRNLNRIAWMPSSDDLNVNGIHAGRSLSGFGLNSLDLPGIGPSKMDGMGDVLGFPDEGPVKDSAVFAELNQLRDNDFVPRNAAVPAIAVPSPFDPAVTLERIQTHMHSWIGMQLLDAAFSAQLDRYLSAAADAYLRNQPKAGKDHLETLRKMLKKEQPAADKEDGNDDNGDKGDDRNANKRFLIDKLAARILDFDLKYVMKRMGGDKGE